MGAVAVKILFLVAALWPLLAIADEACQRQVEDMQDTPYVLVHSLLVRATEPGADITKYRGLLESISWAPAAALDADVQVRALKMLQACSHQYPAGDGPMLALYGMLPLFYNRQVRRTAMASLGHAADLRGWYQHMLRKYDQTIQASGQTAG